MRLSLRHSFAAFDGLPPRLWLLCAVGLVNRAGTMVVPFLTLYLVSERGFDTAEVGLVGVSFGTGAIAGSLLGGFACHRLGVITVTLGSLVLGAAAFFVLPWLDTPRAMAVGVLVASTLNDAFRPALMTAVASTVEPAPPGASAVGHATGPQPRHGPGPGDRGPGRGHRLYVAVHR